MLEDALRDLGTFIKWMIVLVPALGAAVIGLTILLIVKW